MFGQDWIYLVNTKQVELEDDTVLFRLLGNKTPRREAVRQIFLEELEPYMTLLDEFDLEFQKMATTEPTPTISEQQWRNLQELRDTRADVLRELGREDGREVGREDGRMQEAQRVLLRMHHKKFPQEADWNTLVPQVTALGALETLLDHLLEVNEPKAMKQRVLDAEEKRPKRVKVLTDR